MQGANLNKMPGIPVEFSENDDGCGGERDADACSRNREKGHFHRRIVLRVLFYFRIFNLFIEIFDFFSKN